MKNPIYRTHFKAQEQGMIFVKKDNIAVNKGIHESRGVC